MRSVRETRDAGAEGGGHDFKFFHWKKESLKLSEENYLFPVEMRKSDYANQVRTCGDKDG